jgi:hypothetical protein
MSQNKRSGSDADTLELSSPHLKTGPPSSQVKVEIAGATHCGHVRRNNEDHYLAVRFQRSLDILCTNLEESTAEQSLRKSERSVSRGWNGWHGRRRSCQPNGLQNS